MQLYILLMITMTLFFLYWFSAEHDALKKRLSPGGDTTRWFVFTKSLGAVLFGVLCPLAALLLYPRFGLRDFYFGAGSRPWETAVWSIGLSVLLALVSWMKNRFIWKKNGDFGRYPEITKKPWNVSVFAVHFSFWSIYLFGYELLFRGVLPAVLAGETSTWNAVGISAAVYGAVHIPKGAGEAFGALVLGTVLALVSISTKSFLPAWAAHAALAVTNGAAAYYYRRKTR